MGLKNVMRDWLNNDVGYPQPATMDATHQMTSGIPYTCVIYAIEGGFLLRSEANQPIGNTLSSSNNRVTLKFCATAEEITEQIIAKRTLQAITK